MLMKQHQHPAEAIEHWVEGKLIQLRHSIFVWASYHRNVVTKEVNICPIKRFTCFSWFFTEFWASPITMNCLSLDALFYYLEILIEIFKAFPPEKSISFLSVFVVHCAISNIFCCHNPTQTQNEVGVTT